MAKKRSAPARIEPVESQSMPDAAMLKDFAAWVRAEFVRRQTNRQKLEFKWDEVDQQVAMLREERVDAEGRAASDTDWIPELDLPLQAEGVEVLVTDARNLLFGDTPFRWFKGHGALTDKYLKRWNSKGNVVAGDEAGVFQRLNQVGVDALTRATLTHYHRAYDFKSRWDIFNAENFKYGTAVMRGVLARSDLQSDSTYGDVRGSMMPVFVPVSIRNVYLDDATMFATQEGHILRPGHIREFWQKLVDLRLAASLGGPDAGWIPEAIERIRPTNPASKEGKAKPATENQDHDSVQLLEWEGDLTHVMGSETIYAPNLIITVAFMGGDPAVVRVRENGLPFCSYIVGHYQRDDPNSPYGVGPLIKGVPIQKAASESLNDYLQAAALRARPPTSYNPHDPWIAKMGAPRMEPGAMWPALTPPTVIEIGDPGPLMIGFEALAKQFGDFTGVNQVRLGQSTQTHKSAFAVNQESIRGQIRTVDYVDSLKEGAMLECLNKEFQMARMALKGKRQTIWVDEFKGYVEIDADHLPDIATFEVLGAAGPQEEAQENSMFLAVIKALIEVEPMARQLGGKPLDIDRARKEALRRTNVEDVNSYFGAAPAPVAQPVAPGAGAPAATPGGPPAPGAAGGPTAIGPGHAALVVPIGTGRGR